MLMETFVEIEMSSAKVLLSSEAEDTDGLNYLAGKDMTFVNSRALNGTLLAHEEGGVPCMLSLIHI